VYTGFRFTDKGRGMQLENTGSGLLAMLVHHMDHDGPEAQVTPEREILLESMQRLVWDRCRAGIPGSFRKEMLYPRFHREEGENGPRLVPNYMYDPQKNVHEVNTGMSWSYFSNPHTASTIYCALALMYAQDTARAEYNPYSVSVVHFDKSYQATHLPSFITGPLPSMAWVDGMNPVTLGVLKRMRRLVLADVLADYVQKVTDVYHIVDGDEKGKAIQQLFDEHYGEWGVNGLRTDVFVSPTSECTPAQRKLFVDLGITRETLKSIGVCEHPGIERFPDNMQLEIMFLLSRIFRR
jgi:hypothetical protein